MLAVLCVRCPWPLGSCVCAACVLCAALRRVALLCVRCCSALRPACSRALRGRVGRFFLWRVFLGVVVVPWYLILCRGCCWRRASLACLVALRWCAVPRPVELLSVHRSATPAPRCLPLRGTRAPGFTGRLRGACGGRPRTGLLVPAAGARGGGGAGLAPCRTCSEPAMELSPAAAACTAVVLRVLTWSLTRPVSRTLRLSTGTSPAAPGLLRVDVDTPPFASEDNSRIHACVFQWLCSRLSGRPGRVRRASLPSMCGSSCSSGRYWPGRLGRHLGHVLVRLSVAVAVLFFFWSAPSRLRSPLMLFGFSPCAPLVSAFPLFLAPGALGLGALRLPTQPHPSSLFWHPRCSLAPTPRCPWSWVWFCVFFLPRVAAFRVLPAS